MAPMPDSIYLPPLERCLIEGHLLISWRDVFVALSDQTDVFDGRLSDFLSEDQAGKALSQPFNAFSTSTADSKTSFEAKIAAVPVVSNGSRAFDIEEIKADTIWLSGETSIDELSSLRIVVLEYQSRCFEQLRSGFSSEEITGLQQVSGTANTETANLLPRILASVSEKAYPAKTFSSVEARHARLLRQYLSEHRYVLQSAQLVYARGLAKSRREPAENGQTEAEKIDLLDALAGKVFKESGTSDRMVNSFFTKSIQYLDGIFSQLEKGSGWMNGQATPDLESDWFRCQLIEASLILELSLWFLDNDKHGQPRTSTFALRPASVVLSWFRFTSKFGFFDDFDSPQPSIQSLIVPFQSLITMLSLAVLDPWSAIASVDEPVSSSDDDERPYILDISTVSELHAIMMEAASTFSAVASPSLLAWSVILVDIRNTSQIRREARELRQSQKAVEGYEEGSTHNDEGDSRNRRATPSRRSSGSSELSLEAGLHDKIVESISSTAFEDDPVEFLAKCAVDQCHVFDFLASQSVCNPGHNEKTAVIYRLMILDLVRCSLNMTGYISEVVGLVFAALVGHTSFWSFASSGKVQEMEDPILSFLHDDVLRENFLGLAISRYPYESMPFLKIAHALARCQTSNDEQKPIAMTWLEKLFSVTFELPEDFTAYETIQEEENANAIQLIEPLLLFEPRANNKYVTRQLVGNDSSLTTVLGSEDFCIPRGTTGRIVSDAGPKVAVWFHEHSGLRYLGKLLETALTAADFVTASTFQSVDHESLIEIIGLLATLVVTSTHIEKRSNGKLSADGPTHHLLEEASGGLSRGRDIVSVIFTLFDEELERQAEAGTSTSSVNMLVSCVKFIYAVTPVLPGRVWPLLGRSGLLGINSQVGNLQKILSSIEVVVGNYEFLISCLRLFNCLLDDVATNAAHRKVGRKKANRFDDTEDLGTGIPNHVLSKILLVYTRIVLETFSTSPNWRYMVEDQRLEISKLCSSALRTILHYTYGVDDVAEAHTKLIGVLSMSGGHVVECYLSPDYGYMRFQPILRACLDGFLACEVSAMPQVSCSPQEHVYSSFELVVTLVRLSLLLSKPSRQFELQLFRILPLLARIYATDQTRRTVLVQIMEALVVSAANNSTEPPSLLGHLGSRTAGHFIGALSNFEGSLASDSQQATIWNFFVAVISNRQQWFATVLITGNDPRDAMNKTAGSDKSGPKSILQVAVDGLTKINDLRPAVAMRMLEFVTSAQNYWPWATVNTLLSTPFITSILHYVEKLEKQHLVEGPAGNDVLEVCYRNRIATYIAEVLAMSLYHSRQVGSTSSVRDILPKIGIYRRRAVGVPEYNFSLHDLLRRNFETKFSGCCLQDFKKTQLETRVSGPDYFYDVELATKMFSTNQAWLGKNKNGLASEFAKANLNLSVVDAQMTLFRGWEMLALELSESVRSETSLQGILARNVIDCLQANRKPRPPEKIFLQLVHRRADFALIVTQRLVDSRSKHAEILQILPEIWQGILELDVSFGAESSAEDAAHYRTLLKILFLALRPHAGHQVRLPNPKDCDATRSQEVADKLRENNSTVQIVLDVLNRVVAVGFRDVARSIYEQPEDAVPEDIGVITGILQACLRVPGIEFCHRQIVSIMATHDVTRLAMTLFSWSDKLAIEGDPIYGELGILFLLELSSMPIMAEQLAAEGILGYISSASITAYLQHTVVSPLSEGAGPQRCYRIWNHGILPLLLNILDAVGATVAAEVAMFINQFPNLLTASLAAFAAPNTSSRIQATKAPQQLTLSCVSEIHSLAMIMFILTTFRDSMIGIVDVPEVSWDASRAQESAEYWLVSRHVLRERVLPIGPRESEMMKQKSDGPFSNKLEEQIVMEIEGIRDILNGGDSYLQQCAKMAPVAFI